MASFFLEIPWNYVELQRVLWLCSSVLKRQTPWQLWELSNTSGCCGADIVFWCPHPLITCLSWFLFWCLLCVPVLTAFLHLLTLLPRLIDLPMSLAFRRPQRAKWTFSKTGARSKLSTYSTPLGIRPSSIPLSTKWKHLRVSLIEKGDRVKSSLTVPRILFKHPRPGPRLSRERESFGSKRPFQISEGSCLAKLVFWLIANPRKTCVHVNFHV